MITREKALDVIYNLSASDILSEEVLDALNDISICIEEEQIGRHVWGVPDEWIAKIHMSVRTDLYTDDLLDDYDKIHKGIVFTPSTFETKEIRDNVREDMEESVGEEVTDDDIEWFMAR